MNNICMWYHLVFMNDGRSLQGPYLSPELIHTEYMAPSDRTKVKSGFNFLLPFYDGPPLPYRPFNLIFSLERQRVCMAHSYTPQPGDLFHHPDLVIAAGTMVLVWGAHRHFIERIQYGIRTNSQNPHGIAAGQLYV